MLKGLTLFLLKSAIISVGWQELLFSLSVPAVNVVLLLHRKAEKEAASKAKETAEAKA